MTSILGTEVDGMSEHVQNGQTGPGNGEVDPPSGEHEILSMRVLASLRQRGRLGIPDGECLARQGVYTLQDGESQRGWYSLPTNSRGLVYTGEALGTGSPSSYVKLNELGEVVEHVLYLQQSHKEPIFKRIRKKMVQTGEMERYVPVLPPFLPGVGHQILYYQKFGEKAPFEDKVKESGTFRMENRHWVAEHGPARGHLELTSLMTEGAESAKEVAIEGFFTGDIIKQQMSRQTSTYTNQFVTQLSAKGSPLRESVAQSWGQSDWWGLPDAAGKHGQYSAVISVAGANVYGQLRSMVNFHQYQVHDAHAVRQQLERDGVLRSPPAGEGAFTSRSGDGGVAGSGGLHPEQRFFLYGGREDYTSYFPMWVSGWLDVVLGRSGMLPPQVVRSLMGVKAGGVTCRAKVLQTRYPAHERGMLDALNSLRDEGVLRAGYSPHLNMGYGIGDWGVAWCVNWDPYTIHIRLKEEPSLAMLVQYIWREMDRVSADGWLGTNLVRIQGIGQSIPSEAIDLRALGADLMRLTDRQLEVIEAGVQLCADRFGLGVEPKYLAEAHARSWDARISHRWGAKARKALEPVLAYLKGLGHSVCKLLAGMWQDQGEMLKWKVTPMDRLLEAYVPHMGDGAESIRQRRWLDGCLRRFAVAHLLKETRHGMSAAQRFLLYMNAVVVDAGWRGMVEPLWDRTQALCMVDDVGDGAGLPSMSTGTTGEKGEVLGVSAGAVGEGGTIGGIESGGTAKRPSIPAEVQEQVECPLLLEALREGRVPVGVLFEATGQPVNREWGLWQWALGEERRRTIVEEMTRDVVRRTQYSRRMTGYFAAGWRLERWLNEHAPLGVAGRDKGLANGMGAGGWCVIPKVIETSGDLELEELQRDGTSKRVSALTPTVRQTEGVVELPYVSLRMGSTVCFVKDYVLSDVGVLDLAAQSHDPGAMFDRPYERRLNGRDDYGLMYYTLTGSDGNRGYPTFLIILERLGENAEAHGMSTRVHFHRVLPCRSFNGIPTPTSMLIRRCYRYMTGLDAAMVTIQQGDMIFQRIDSLPAGLDLRTGIELESYESHTFEPIPTEATTDGMVNGLGNGVGSGGGEIRFFPAESGPDNLLGYLQTSGTWRLTHHEHVTVGPNPGGVYRVYRCRSFERNPAGNFRARYVD